MRFATGKTQEIQPSSLFQVGKCESERTKDRPHQEKAHEQKCLCNS
jgi:hypothetical protein